MPEHLRTLIVILVLATAVFAFAKAPACAAASTTGDFDRRRNLWLGITLMAFLAHNFWIYIAGVGLMLLFVAPREPNKMALYFFVLFAVPPLSAPISGLGVINHFFAIDYPRLLALTVLLPAFLHLAAQPDTERFGRSLPDKFLLGYLILQGMLMLYYSSLTNTLRVGVFYQFIDVFLPYYVASRALKNLRQFRDVLMAFVVATLVLSAIGLFEYVRHWLLYSPLENALGVRWGFGNYLGRGDSLRAQGSTGQPIVLGYIMAVAIGFFLYLKKSVPNTPLWHCGLTALCAGLFASISRGPWVGAAAMLLIYIAMGPAPAKNIIKLGVLGGILFLALLVSPYSEKVIDLLPFVGTADVENITYRQRLLEISVQLMLQNPILGAADFMYSPAMQELKQGEGIIDLVNTFVGIGLSSGFVGLFFFTGFFLAVLAGIYKAMRGLADRNDEQHLLGQALLSVLLGILVIIFTVSSVSVIPLVYWSVAGLGAAYVRMLALARVPQTAPHSGHPSSVRLQPTGRTPRPPAGRSQTPAQHKNIFKINKL